jgi:hypothetical protein
MNAGGLLVAMVRWCVLLLSANHYHFFNLVGKLLMQQQFVNGNYYIDLTENCNHFNACTIYYFVLILLVGKSGAGKMSEKMTEFDHVKNDFLERPLPENPQIGL